MTADQKKILRDALVAALVTSDPVSLPLATLMQVARLAGFRISEEDLEAHLSYLVKSGLVAKVEVRLSRGMNRWEATSEGVDYAESEGIA